MNARGTARHAYGFYGYVQKSSQHAGLYPTHPHNTHTLTHTQLSHPHNTHTLTHTQLSHPRNTHTHTHTLTATVHRYFDWRVLKKTLKCDVGQKPSQSLALFLSFPSQIHSHTHTQLTPAQHTHKTQTHWSKWKYENTHRNNLPHLKSNILCSEADLKWPAADQFSHPTNIHHTKPHDTG